MGIRRYKCDRDNTITDAFKEDLKIRATGSNAGGADSLEIFSIFGQGSSSLSTGSVERSRALLYFPIDKISVDRTNGIIPKSGSVDFFLKLFNSKHPNTVPKNFKLEVLPLSRCSF